MPDFSSVSPKTWEEKVLDSIINGTDIGLDSQAKTLLEFQLERQAGITDIDTDFSSVNPRTAREKLLDAIINGSSYTGSVKDFIERSLKAKLNVDTIDPTQAKSYLEYLYAQGLASGEINSSLLKRYGFPYPNDYLFASFMDKEIKNLFANSEKAVGTSSSTSNSTLTELSTLVENKYKIYNLNITNAATHWWYRDFTVLPSTTYTYTIWVKSATLTEWRLAVYDSNSASFIVYDPKTISSDWTKFTYTFTTSASATTVRLYFSRLVNATGDIQISRVALNQASTSLPYVASDTKQLLVDSSGNGNDGYRGSTPNSGIIDDGKVIRYRNFGTASNHFKITKPGMGNTLEYDIYKLGGSVVTRTRDVTALSELIFGNTDADFIGSTLKVVCKDGVGGSVVATIDFASASHGVTKFISSSGHTVTVVKTDGTDSADGTWLGNGKNYDGTDDKDVLSVVVPDGNYTISVLATCTKASGFSTLFSGYLDTSNQRGLLLFSNLQPKIEIRDSVNGLSSLSAVSLVTSGAFNVITGVRNGNKLQIYVNGVFSAETGAITFPAISAGVVNLGSRNGALFHQGIESGAWLVNKALSATEIAAKYQAIKDYLTAQNQTAILADLP